MNDDECKYPAGKKKGDYFRMLYSEYKKSDQHQISEDKIKFFLLNAIHTIASIINRYGEREKNILILSQLSTLKQEEFNNIEIDMRDPFDSLFFAIHESEDAITKSMNKGNVLSPDERMEIEKAKLLKEITLRCINDIVNANIEQEYIFTFKEEKNIVPILKEETKEKIIEPRKKYLLTNYKEVTSKPKAEKSRIETCSSMKENECSLSSARKSKK